MVGMIKGSDLNGDGHLVEESSAAKELEEARAKRLAEEEEIQKAREKRFLVSKDGEVLCSVLYDKLLVQQDAEETKTAGGVVIPEAHAKRVSEGVVLDVGEGRLRANGGLTPLLINEGDRVIYNEYAGVPLREEFGERLVILREDEVLAVRKS
jgi:chaperonin GroES